MKAVVLFLGADLASLFDAESDREVPEIVGAATLDS